MKSGKSLKKKEILTSENNFKIPNCRVPQAQKMQEHHFAGEERQVPKAVMLLSMDSQQQQGAPTAPFETRTPSTSSCLVSHPASQ